MLSWVAYGQSQLPSIRVSDDHRYLVTADGKPFFWLADTAWELFHRTSKTESPKIDCPISAVLTINSASKVEWVVSIGVSVYGEGIQE